MLIEGCSVIVYLLLFLFENIPLFIQVTVLGKDTEQR